MVGQINSGLYASSLGWNSPSVKAQRAQSTQEAPGQGIDPLAQLQDKQLKRLGLKECKTCQSRTYVDSSNDPGVSFKTPTQLSPAAADSAVRAHEGEHVYRETAKAESQNRRVISQSVQIFTDICPECGRVYTSGGKTTTVTAAQSESNPYLQKGLLIDQLA